MSPRKAGRIRIVPAEADAGNFLDVCLAINAKTKAPKNYPCYMKNTTSTVSPEDSTTKRRR
jgi:hypothetical protein